MKIRTTTFVLVLALAGIARAQEPGVAAIDSARAAIAKVAATAASPTPGTAALGKTVLDLAKPGAPGAAARGQAADSAAQPYWSHVEPRLVALETALLDRRYRFLHGEDRPPAPPRERTSLVLDVRSITGSWRGKDHDPALAPLFKGDEPLIAASDETDPKIVARTVHFDREKLAEVVGNELGDEGQCSADADALYVEAFEEALPRVRALVDQFRVAARKRIALEVAAYRLPRDLWRDRLDEAALARAVAAGKVQLLEARTAVVEDGALERLAPSSRRSFLVREDVNQTGIVPVVDPVVSSLALGLHGEVRATLVPGRPEAFVDVELALRELRTLKKAGSLDLPESFAVRCATTLLVPLGRAVLVGGSLDEGCVFSVKVSRFAEKPVRDVLVTEKAKLARTPSTRPEVQELDALLDLVEVALARVRAARRYEWAIFDARDLLEGAHARRAPRLGLPPVKHPSAGKSGGSFMFDDDDSEAAFGLDADKLESIIKNATGGDDAWNEPASYELHRGQVIVRQTPGTLARISKLVEVMRTDRSRNVEATIEFWRVEDALLAELKGPALGKEALARLEAAGVRGVQAARVGAGFVIAARGDVAVLHAGLEAAYVSLVDRSSGGVEVPASVAVPRVGLTRSGIALEALGRGDLASGEGALVLEAHAGLAHVAETWNAKATGGTFSLPSIEHARTAFGGLIAPDGGVLVVVDRRQGERPVVVAILRAR